MWEVCFSIKCLWFPFSSSLLQFYVVPACILLSKRLELYFFFFFLTKWLKLSKMNSSMQLILLICKSSNFSVFYVFSTLSNWKLNVSLVSPKMCRTAAAACSTAWQSGGRSCHFPCGLLTPTSIMVPSHCFPHKITLCCFLWGWGDSIQLIVIEK